MKKISQRSFFLFSSFVFLILTSCISPDSDFAEPDIDVSSDTAINTNQAPSLPVEVASVENSASSDRGIASETTRSKRGRRKTRRKYRSRRRVKKCGPKCRKRARRKKARRKKARRKKARRKKCRTRKCKARRRRQAKRGKKTKGCPFRKGPMMYGTCSKSKNKIIRKIVGGQWKCYSRLFRAEAGSSCSHKKYHNPKKAKNPHVGIGICALEKSAAIRKRNGRGKVCRNISTFARQVKCCRSIMRKHGPRYFGTTKCGKAPRCH